MLKVVQRVVWDNPPYNPGLAGTTLLSVAKRCLDPMPKTTHYYYELLLHELDESGRRLHAALAIAKRQDGPCLPLSTSSPPYPASVRSQCPGPSADSSVDFAFAVFKKPFFTRGFPFFPTSAMSGAAAGAAAGAGAGASSA